MIEVVLKFNLIWGSISRLLITLILNINT